MSFGLIKVDDEEVELWSDSSSCFLEESLEGFLERKAKCCLTSSLARLDIVLLSLFSTATLTSFLTVLVMLFVLS